MRFINVWLCLLLTSGAVYGRLGDTLQKAEERYGPPKKTTLKAGRGSLLEGARIWEFEYKGWRITCAMLMATDGREYVVRERYQKVWNSKVMKEGGTYSIRDYEERAILEAEGGKSRWKKRIYHNGKGEVSPSVEMFFGGVTGPAWVRDDGAIADRQLSQIMILDLPQARLHEQQLKDIRDRQQREKARELYQ